MRFSKPILRLAPLTALAWALVLHGQEPEAPVGGPIHLDEEYSAPYLERAKAHEEAGRWKAAIASYDYVA